MKRRTQGRSSSKKRRRSTSVDKEDEDMLVRMLNERASSDRHILISREQFDELKHCKSLLKEITARAKYNEKQLATLQLENSRLDKERAQLKSELQLRVHEPGDLKFPKSACKKLINSASKKLASHTKMLMTQNLSASVKSQLTKHLKQISSDLEKIYEVIHEETEESEHQPPLRNDETIGQYRNMLEKMKNQTQNLREKLSQLESGGNLKEVVHEQEMKINGLIQEKEMLNSHIGSLQTSLNEQTAVIEHLKGVIANFSVQTPGKESVVPPLDLSGTPSRKFHFEEHHSEERELQDEIAALDVEIQELQNSLHRALSNVG